MRLGVIAVGRMKAGPERTLADRYTERAIASGRVLGFVGLNVVEINESRSSSVAARKADEAAQISTRLAGAATIVFDERGTPCSSEAFASRLGAFRDAGTPALTLVIGGPDGLDAKLREGAALALSFGAMTLPHQLVRVLVLEQLYRAMTILAGHPYHRV